VLRAFAIIYLVMAGIAMLTGIVAAGWALVAAPWNVGNRIMLALLALSGTFFLVVGSLAIAEIIKLFMDIEHNTRLTAMRRPETPLTSEPAMETAIRGNRLREMDEETAESALLRGR
jgi:hypothetical protein